jgi:hypothetical protein
MPTPETLKTQLLKLVEDVNLSLGYEKLKFNQQPKTPKNISVTGGNGRLTITPTTKGYDIGLSNDSLVDELFGFLCDLTGKPKNDKFGFPREQRSPKWEVESFLTVKKAVLRYSKTVL